MVNNRTVLKVKSNLQKKSALKVSKYVIKLNHSQNDTLSNSLLNGHHLILLKFVKETPNL